MDFKKLILGITCLVLGIILFVNFVKTVIKENLENDSQGLDVSTFAKGLVGFGGTLLIGIVIIYRELEKMF